MAPETIKASPCNLPFITNIVYFLYCRYVGVLSSNWQLSTPEYIYICILIETFANHPSLRSPHLDISLNILVIDTAIVTFDSDYRKCKFYKLTYCNRRHLYLSCLFQRHEQSIAQLIIHNLALSSVFAFNSYGRWYHKSFIKYNNIAVVTTTIPIYNKKKKN